MAFRKATIKEQFDRTLAQMLEPGEQVRAGVLSQSGPTPWLAGAVGMLMMLILGMRYHFVAVTDRRVVFMKASMLSGRPQGLDWADARETGSVSDVDADASLWSHFRYARPGDGKTIRFNVHRIWRDELRDVLVAMTAPAAAIPPPPPPAI